MVDILQKINEFIEKTTTLRNAGYTTVDEDERALVSSKLKGLITANFGESRKKEYGDHLNYNINNWDSPALKYHKATKNMLQFLEILKGEVEFAPTEKIREDPLNKLKDEAKKHKLESQRRKNVAEFKSWGLVIEMIESVRAELKIFRKSQEGLTKKIDELLDELKVSKGRK